MLKGQKVARFVGFLSIKSQKAKLLAEYVALGCHGGGGGGGMPPPVLPFDKIDDEQLDEIAAAARVAVVGVVTAAAAAQTAELIRDLSQGTLLSVFGGI